MLDSGNFVIKQVLWDAASGVASSTRVAGTGTRAAAASANTQGVAATSVALGTVMGLVMHPSTCDVFFTERVRALAAAQVGRAHSHASKQYMP